MPNPALVQHTSASFSNVSSASCTFGSAVTIGNRCIVGVTGFPNTSTVSSITDNGTTPNSYNDDNANLNDSTVGDNINTRSAQVTHNPSSGNLKVTVTLSGGASGDVFVQEVSNLSTAANAVDVTGTSTHTANNVTSLAITTSGASSAANEYCFALVGFETNATSFAGASGTTLDDSNSSNGDLDGHKLAAGGGTETCNFSWTNNSGYVAQITVYKLAAAANNPFKNSALSMVQTTPGGKPARRRVGFWHTIADQTPRFLFITDNGLPVTNIAEVTVLSGARGRRPNNRGKIATRTDTASFFNLDDVVISQIDDRLWSTRIPKFRNNEQQQGPFFAGLSQYVYPPKRKMAEFYTATTQNGRAARRRIGFWHKISDYVNISLSDTAGNTPQPLLSHSPVTAGPRGRRPRRLGDWISTDNHTQTVFSDNVISLQAGRGWRTVMPKHRNNEQSWAMLNTWLGQPLRKLAEWWVQQSFYGRPARRRVGFWHSIADSVSTLLQSEIPSLGNYSVWVQSGKTRGRRRSTQNIVSSTNTQTLLQENFIGKSVQQSWKTKIGLGRQSDGQRGLQYTILQAFTPIRQLASVMIQATRGSRAARRRVGTWHQVADQHNTFLGAAGELPPRMIANVSMMTGRVRSRRRWANWKGSNETRTIFQDVAISKPAKDRIWKANAIGPAEVHYYRNKANYFVKFTVLLQASTKTVTGIAPGLVRTIGAFPDAVIVQFRAFRIGLLNKIDKP